MQPANRLPMPSRGTYAPKIDPFGISLWREIQILSSYQLGIVDALDATHDEIAPRDILEVIDKKCVDQRPSGSAYDG